MQLCAVVLFLGALMLTTACSGGGTDLDPPQFDTGISIEEALTREAGETSPSTAGSR